MGSDETGQLTDRFANEVAGRFGVLPNFFCSAPAAAGLIEELWAFAKSGYLDNPLPSLFKERLFVHLSRFCEVRYCIVRHVGFLMGDGRPAGDPAATPHTLEQALTLLRRPVPDAVALDQAFVRLEARAQPGDLPSPETQAEADLFVALTVIFLVAQRSARARDAVRKAVGERHFELLAAFLAFVRTAHYWTETHPELAYEPDMLACMERHPELARLLLNATEAEEAKSGPELREALSTLQRTEGALRRSEAWLAGQKEAFQAAMDGAPLEVSLAYLIRTAIEQAESTRRCAFYIADAEGKTLRHVVGMPDAYARCVNGFEISPESLACGLAVASGEPIVTADVQEEPRWEPWLWMARQFDFRGCWSFPIEAASGRRVGTFAMYFRQPREPTPRDRELAAALTQTAAIIISRHQETEERTQAEQALRASEERLRQFGEASSNVLWIRDAETLQWVYLTPAFEQIYGLDRETALRGDNLTGWLDLVVPEDRERVHDTIQRVCAGEYASFEYRIRRSCDGAVRHLRDTDFPMRDPTGEVCWIGGVGRDITEEKAAAERQGVLVRELQHRSRNLLAVVTSLANRTVGQGGSVESFTTRLKALSRAQALLSQSGSDTVEVGALVNAELAAHADGESTHITTAGPKVLLTSQQVQNFALAVHELTTNAAKYGALKSDTGQLSVTWERTQDEGGGGHLALNWIESGVDVQPEKVTRRGFGQELIEEALAYALQAQTEYELGKDGVRCRIAMPLA